MSDQSRVVSWAKSAEYWQEQVNRLKEKMAEMQRELVSAQGELYVYKSIMEMEDQALCEEDVIFSSPSPAYSPSLLWDEQPAVLASHVKKREREDEEEVIVQVSPSPAPSKREKRKKRRNEMDMLKDLQRDFEKWHKY